MARLKRRWPWSAVPKVSTPRSDDAEMARTKRRVRPPAGPQIQMLTPLEEAPGRKSVSFWSRMYSPKTTEAYRIYLGAVSSREAENFMNVLVSVLTQPESDTFYGALLRSMVKEPDPFIRKRGLRLLPDLEYELYDLEIAKVTAYDHQMTIRATVNRSLDLEVPLNFSYQAKDEIAAVRRVNVTAVHADYFIGQHSRGVRNYRYSRVLQAVSEGETKKAVTSDCQIKILIQPGGNAKAELSFGDLSIADEYMTDVRRTRDLQKKLQEDLLELDDRLAALNRIVRHKGK